MKSLFFVPLAVFSLVINGRAGPTERAILAAMKLSEQPNYGWISSISDDARTYDIEGKTDVSGYTWMRLPMVKAFEERLGRDAGADLEAFFRSSSAYVVCTDGGWKTFKELPKPSRDRWRDNNSWPAPASARAALAASAMAGIDPLDPSGPMQPLLVMPPLDDSDRAPYSNAQFALTRPHEELAVIVSSYQTFNVDDNIVTGRLTELGSALLLIRDGQDQLQPLAAAGTFRLVITGGIVTRYQVRLEGVLLVDRKKVRVRQDATTFVRDIGTTRFEVPDEARRKLGP